MCLSGENSSSVKECVAQAEEVEGENLVKRRVCKRPEWRRRLRTRGEVLEDREGREAALR